MPRARRESIRDDRTSPPSITPSSSTA